MQKRQGNKCYLVFFGPSVEIRLHRRPGMDDDYCVAAVQPAASNSPPDCCIK